MLQPPIERGLTTSWCGRNRHPGQSGSHSADGADGVPCLVGIFEGEVGGDQAIPLERVGGQGRIRGEPGAHGCRRGGQRVLHRGDQLGWQRPGVGLKKLERGGALRLVRAPQQRREFCRQLRSGADRFPRLGSYLGGVRSGKRQPALQRTLRTQPRQLGQALPHPRLSLGVHLPQLVPDLLPDGVFALVERHAAQPTDAHA